MSSVVPAGNNEVMLLFCEHLLGEALNHELHPAKIAYTAYFWLNVSLYLVIATFATQ